MLVVREVLLASCPLLRLKVNAFDQRGFQCEGEVVKRLQDADEGVDSGAVSEHGRFLVHSQDHRALDQQGEPLGQQAVSARQTVGMNKILTTQQICCFNYRQPMELFLTKSALSSMLYTWTQRCTR